MKTVIKSDFDFFRKVMPNYFIEIYDTQKGENIRCRSNFGIETEDEWQYLMEAFRQRWKDRFIEVNHAVCTNYSDFTIYLKPEYSPKKIFR